MYLEMIGIDHSCASVEKREKFSFTRKSAAEFMKELKEQESVSGCVLLSTCNRTELYVSYHETLQVPLVEWICRKKGQDMEQFTDLFFEKKGAEAIHHLFYLASGLRSRIFGEDQILTQVKDAQALAHENYCTDKTLEVLFRYAVTAAKRVKTEVTLHKGNYGAANKMIETLKAQGFSFAQKKCLVIGNGEMGRLTAELLRQEQAEVRVTVRQYRSGVIQIPQGCARIDYGERYSYMPKCDVVISATASPNVTISAEAVAAFAGKRDQVYIDLAVPRDIDPKIAQQPGVTLYDIDSFQIRERSAKMEAQYEQAAAILEEKIREYENWEQSQDLLKEIRSISACYAQELSWRMGAKAGKLGLEKDRQKVLQEEVMETATKVFEKMLFTLRDGVENRNLRECLEVLDHK